MSRCQSRLLIMCLKLIRVDDGLSFLIQNAILINCEEFKILTLTPVHVDCHYKIYSETH
jgi:hypothetical protein